MKIRTDPDDRAERLLQPVAALLSRSLDRLPAVPRLGIRVDTLPEGVFYQLSDRTLTLSAWLEGPGVSHPSEPVGPLPPMDRWRRAAGSVLEAMSLLALAEQCRQPPGTDWLWLGPAIYAADAVAPELGLADPDLAVAIATGDLGGNPRAGVAVARAWRAQGHDPIQRARYLLEGGILSTREWLTLGAWVWSTDGAAARLPVPVPRPAEHDVPCALPPWSWVGLSIPAHPRGGEVVVEGDGELLEPWAVAEVPHRTLAGATIRGCRLEPAPGGPVGRWEVASAQGFGQVMGARGIQFEFHGSGALQLVLADAFVGPLAALAVAEEVGTSGVVWGRWQVAGNRTVAFRGIAPQSLTMHGRRADRFAVPAHGFGLGQWLSALSDSPWAWVVRGDRLVMRGEMMGGPVEVRFRQLP